MVRAIDESERQRRGVAASWGSIEPELAAALIGSHN